MIGQPRLVRNALLVPAEGLRSPAGDSAIQRFHATLPGYTPTPLIEAPTCAQALGVARVLVKDESNRLGMSSFKILGASWATYRAVCSRLGFPTEAAPGLDELRALLKSARQLTLVAATDGNHGRAVARMARLLDLGAHILVPADIALARVQAIAGEGARVTMVDDGYDAAVARSAQLADADHVVVSDTSWPGYMSVPQSVIDGYQTIGTEIEAQLQVQALPRPTVVAVQIGVGALAASVVRHFRSREARIVGVEPTQADCVAASVEAGQTVTIPGPQTSIMAGLNCGTPSLIAWPVISGGIESFIVIEDEPARDAMRLLAQDGVVSGESGAAGLAGLLDRRHELDMTNQDTVLVLSTEGATDPAAYAAIIGASARALVD